MEIVNITEGQVIGQVTAGEKQITRNVICRKAGRQKPGEATRYTLDVDLSDISFTDLVLFVGGEENASNIISDYISRAANLARASVESEDGKSWNTGVALTLITNALNNAGSETLNELKERLADLRKDRELAIEEFTAWRDRVDDGTATPEEASINPKQHPLRIKATELKAKIEAAEALIVRKSRKREAKAE